MGAADPRAAPSVVGCSGSGKGSILRGIAAGLAPAIATDTARLWGVDLKRGVEIGMGAPLFTTVATTPTDAVRVLRRLLGVIDVRGASMVGRSRLHEPTAGDPLHVLVIDELAALTAYADAETKREASRLLSEVLTQGRALGVVVLACVQDPRKETVGMRGLFTQTIALRLRSAEETRMVLGDGTAVAAPAHRVSPAAPGCGWVIEDDGTADRVRADHWPDPLVRTVAARYPAPILEEPEQDKAARQAPHGPQDDHGPQQGDGPQDAAVAVLSAAADEAAPVVVRSSPGAQATLTTHAPQKPTRHAGFHVGFAAGRAGWAPVSSSWWGVGGVTRRVDVDAIAKRPAWMQQAACADSPELPWIEEHKQTRGYPRRVMAGICAQCPVLTECDQYASTSRYRPGSGPAEPAPPKTTDAAGGPTSSSPRPPPPPNSLRPSRGAGSARRSASLRPCQSSPRPPLRTRRARPARPPRADHRQRPSRPCHGWPDPDHAAAAAGQPAARLAAAPAACWR